jgi:hypothetical protein
MLVAALAQRALRHAERPTDVGDARRRFSNEQSLEPGQNVSMAAAGRLFLLRPIRQTLDQCLEQLLLQSVSGLKIRQAPYPLKAYPNVTLMD